MASEKVTKILDEISELTLLEAAELAKAFEEKFGVTAAAPMTMAMMPGVPGAAAEAVEEKTAFDVILKEVPADKKIPIIKEVRAVTGLGLKEAKDLVEGAPKPVKEGVSKDEANQIKEKLAAAGAVVEVK